MKAFVVSACALFLIGTLMPPSCSFAETRAEQWEKLRQEKLKALVPNKRNKAESILYQVEKGGINFSYKGFYPSIASVATGAGFGGQLRYWRQHFLMHGMDFQILGAYTTRRYQVYNLQIGKIMKKGIEPLVGSGGSGGFSDFHGLNKRRQQDFFLYADLRYRYFPQEDYFGTGPDSSQADQTDYLLEAASAGMVSGYKLGRYALVAGAVSYQTFDVRPGTDSRFPTTQDVFTDAEAPGRIRSRTS